VDQQLRYQSVRLARCSSASAFYYVSRTICCILCFNRHTMVNAASTGRQYYNLCCINRETLLYTASTGCIPVDAVYNNVCYMLHQQGYTVIFWINRETMLYSASTGRQLMLYSALTWRQCYILHQQGDSSLFCINRETMLHAALTWRQCYILHQQRNNAIFCINMETVLSTIYFMSTISYSLLTSCIIKLYRGYVIIICLIYLYFFWFVRIITLYII